MAPLMLSTPASTELGVASCYRKSLSELYQPQCNTSIPFLVTVSQPNKGRLDCLCGTPDLELRQLNSITAAYASIGHLCKTLLQFDILLDLHTLHLPTSIHRRDLHTLPSNLNNSDRWSTAGTFSKKKDVYREGNQHQSIKIPSTAQAVKVVCSFSVTA